MLENVLKWSTDSDISLPLQLMKTAVRAESF